MTSRTSSFGAGANAGPGSSDQTDTLIARVEALAALAGKESIEAARQQASALLSDARAAASLESRETLAQVREQMGKQVRRGLQAARLEARAQSAELRWSELDRVMVEALAEIERIRRDDPGRWAEALERFLRSAAAAIGEKDLVVVGNPEDVGRLRAGTGLSEIEIEPVAGDADPGILVQRRDRNVSVDQSIAARHRRMEEELRLLTAETMFPENYPENGGNGE